MVHPRSLGETPEKKIVERIEKVRLLTKQWHLGRKSTFIASQYAHTAIDDNIKRIEEAGSASG